VIRVGEYDYKRDGVRCRYCQPTDAIVIDSKGRKHAGENFLCLWAEESPEGVSAMAKAPQWAQRNCIAGHLMQPDDCQTCQAFTPPIEGLSR
jgi:hypothetical protein